VGKVLKYGTNPYIWVLVFILLFGLWVRVEDYRTWKENPEICFVDGEPVLGALDGYYYLRLARDLYEGTYNDVDEMRHSPKFERERPNPPPLLSVLGACMAQGTPWSLNKIGLFLPAFLGVLMVIPLYGIGMHFGGRITGLVAAFFGVIAPYYVYRSAMGWFDTDCMNVTWTLMGAWCFLEFGLHKTVWRYAWLVAGFVCTALFAWWWDQTVQAALLLSLLPLGSAVVFLYRPKAKSERIVLLILVVLALLFCAWQWAPIGKFAQDFYAKAYTRIIQISDVSSAAFPAQKISTTEQVRPTFMKIVAASTRNVAVFYLALGGLIWMVFKHFRYAATLVSLFGVSIMAVMYAERFVIFIIPLIAFGQGYLVCRLWGIRNTRCVRESAGAVWISRLVPVVGVIFIVFMAYAPLKAMSAAMTSWPKHNAVQLSVMTELAELTPTNAVIWAWWDKGHAVNYWSRRRTIIDGARHGQRASVCNALPLATTNERFAANFIQFYGTRSSMAFWYVTKGLGCSTPEAMEFVKKVLSAGPQDARKIIREANLKPIANYRDVKSWLKYFFPPDAPPMYLYLDEHYIDLAHWWYWYGTWDTSKRDGIHPIYRPVYNLTFNGESISNPQGFYLDTKNGVIKAGEQWVPLKAIVVRTDEYAVENAYERPQGGRFEMATATGFGVLMSENIAESIFNRLFVRLDPTMKYFKPVVQHSPLTQVWEVHGDKLGGL